MFEERQSKTFIKVLRQDGEDVRGREREQLSEQLLREKEQEIGIVSGNAPLSSKLKSKTYCAWPSLYMD